MAAGYIKGITIEFGANTEKLNGALKNLNGKLNKTQAELRQIDRSLKFNPGNTKLLEQKFKVLSQTVSQTQRKLDGLRMMQKRMESSGVDRSSAAYRELEREIIKTENQLKKAQGDLRKVGSVGKQQALAVGNAFKTAGGKIKSAGRTITTSVSVYGMAGIYAGSKLIDMANQQSEAENKLAEIYRKRMGVGKKAVQSTLALASAEQKAGVVGDEVQLSAAQQLATYAQYPETVNTMLPAINDLLVQQKGLNATQEDAAGLANLFGKAMMGQTGALKKAGISFTEAQEEILKTGTEEEKAATIAEVVTQNVGDMNEAFANTDAGKIQQAKNALGDMGEEIGAILLPAVADLVGWFQSNLMPKIQQFIDFMKEHPNIAKFAIALAAITAAAGPLIMIIGSLVGLIGSMVTITTALDVALLPIIGTVAAIVAGIALLVAIGVVLYKNWDTIKKFAQKTWNKIKTTLTTIVNSIKTAIVTKFTAMKTSIYNTWNNIKTKVSTTITSIKEKISTTVGKIKEKVSTTFQKIKSAITDPIDSAKQKVSDAVSAIKGLFPFDLGHILKFKLPKITLKTASKTFFGKEFKYPTDWGISWHKKAMYQPYMFGNATLFGAGEAGDEVLYGRSALMRDIAEAVGGNGGNITINVYGSDGMSVNELASAVERKLIQAQKRRTEAWA